MGTQFLIRTRTMKFLVVLALVAAAYAEPEAEANAEAEPWWYSNYGYASPYYSGYRYGYSPYYNWGGYRYLWKRNAEAKAQPLLEQVRLRLQPILQLWRIWRL